MDNIIWNKNFAYAIGLMAADGNMSTDGRHMTFVSKDIDLVRSFINCLRLKNRISAKSSSYSKDKKKKYYLVQFGNVKLYNFLTDIGLTPKKSKSIGPLLIPYAYFSDFLRGLIDGDGSIGYFMHPESKKKQFRIRIASASVYFLEWLRKKLTMRLETKGSITNVPRAYQIAYYKDDSYKIANFIYYNENVISLNRKYEKAKLMLKREWRNRDTLTA